MIVRSTEEFIIKSKKIHGDKYNYSLVNYKSAGVKVKIICEKHGIFQQRPTSHYIHGCNECGNDRVREKMFNPLTKFYKSLFDSYNTMIARCYNPNNSAYHNYGGRGIKICDRWLGEKGFENFIEDMREKPGKNYSLDRIDNNGNYEPANCRWATRKEQGRNKRDGVYVTYKDCKKLIIDWCDELGLNYSLVRRRIRDLNWPVEKAFTKPSLSPSPRKAKHTTATGNNRNIKHSIHNVNIIR